MPISPVTLRVARLIAAHFAQHALIDKVEIFGSVARDGRGCDLDVILITNEEVALEYANVLQQAIATFLADDFLSARGIFPREHRSAYACAPRVVAGEQVLGTDFTVLMRQADGIVSMNMFVLWPGWQENLTQVQQLCPQDDPLFWDNVARDAYTIFPYE